MWKSIVFSFISLVWLSYSYAGDGFVSNSGQWEGSFAFKGDIPGGAVFLEENALTFHLVDTEMRKKIHDRTVEPPATMRHHSFQLVFKGANTGIDFETEDQASYYNNYYLGNDRSKWRSKVHPVGKVIYKNLYDGIDLHVIHDGMSIKYEFHLDAGVDPKIIQIETKGLDDLFQDRDGNLILRTSLQDIVEKHPYAYQTRGSQDYDINCAFQIEGNYISYQLEGIDPNLPLVIDPVIIFSTYSGSTVDNWGFTATPDKDGHLYAGGIVFGTGYPVTSGAFDVDFNQGNHDVAITKYGLNGTSLIYSTYLGGGRLDQPHSMIVNDMGNLYVLGTTGSSNFPTTPAAYDDSFNGGPFVSVSFPFQNGSDLFLTAFNSSGTTLLSSTYLGGEDNDGLNTSDDLAYNYADEFRGEVNLDIDGNVYVASATMSADFPHTSNSFNPNHNGLQDGVILKLTASLGSLIWGGFLGGSNDDAAYGVSIADDGSLYTCGGTRSSNFPVVGNALFSNYQGGRADGYLTHISADGSNILHSTYYGTNDYDQIQFVQLDKQDRPNLYGQTEHSGSALIFNANFNDQGGGQILGVLSPDLSQRIWSTQFGSTPGRPNISPTAFLVDVCNSVYLSGWGGELNQTNGNNNASTVQGLPTTQDAFQSQPDANESDFYLAVISSDGNSLVFGSFYGGNLSDDHVDGGTSRFDRGGKIYQSICASCGGFNSDFPTEPDPGAWSNTNNSNNCNNAVFKIDFELPIIVADFNMPSFACAPYTASIQNNSIMQGNTTFNWDFGNGTTSTAINPSVTYNEKGEYEVRLIVSDPTSCNLHDTLIRTITIAQDTNYQLPDIVKCIGEQALLGPDPLDYQDLSNATISWQPAGSLDDPTALNPIATVTESTIFRLVIDYGGCQERILQAITIDEYPITTSEDTILCSTYGPFEIFGSAYGEAETFEWSRDRDFETIIGNDSILEVTRLTGALNYFYFRTTKANGCEMTDSVLITLSDLDIELTSDTTICKNDSIKVEAISKNPLNTFVYIWTFDRYTTDTSASEFDTDQNFITLLPDTLTKVYLTALSKKSIGCNASDEVSIDISLLDPTTVSAYAEQDTFYRGELIQLYGEPSEGGFITTWEPTTYMTNSDTYTPLVRPKEKTDFIWTVTDGDAEQCSFSDTVTLSPYEIVCDTPEIYIPTAFSPNNDGVNDELLVHGRNIESMVLIIHDRWGNEVFRSTDQKDGWDGMYKGEQADRAVYVYQLEATCPTKEVFKAKGNVTKLQ